MASPDLQKLKLAYDKIAPQHWDEAKQDWDYDKGSDGALHTKQIGEAKVSDASLQAKIDALNAKIDGILDGSTPASTQLKGSKVEKYKKLLVVDSLAITDTDHHRFSIDKEIISSTNEIIMEIYSTLDQNANIGFLSNARISGADVIADEKGNLMTFVMPANQVYKPRLIDKKTLPALASPPLNDNGKVYFRIWCGAPPTTGLINVICNLKIN